MKTSKPVIQIEQLREFFEGSYDLKKQRAQVKKKAEALLWYLNRGMVRVCNGSDFTVNTWVKKGILAYFQTGRVFASSAGCFEYFDKFPVKKRQTMKDVRVLPGAIARYGSFIEPGVILMPSFINVGAYVGKGTMVDTWATVGSCAQIGAHVHLSGGVGIGGVLEPAQAQPVIVEDGAFIGSRVVLVEGVRVGKEAVLGAGVVLTASTKIIDVRGSEPVVTTGKIPERAVVIPGVQQKRFNAGDFGVPCAMIIGTRSQSTDLKTSLNSALRDYGVSA